MAVEIFNLYENKYLLGSEIFVKLESRISDWMELDAYNKQYELYSIANIYYDTPDSHLIRTSLGKPKYKEKLRIRYYGTPDSASKVYVEIKKKVAGLTNKRRSAMTLGEAVRFLETGQPPALRPEMNAQVRKSNTSWISTSFFPHFIWLTTAAHTSESASMIYA